MKMKPLYLKKYLITMEKILKATLHRRWFDAIAQGQKTEEYREIKPYWTKRLEKSYDVVQFKNGYRKDAPVMRVEYLGHQVKTILHPITGRLETVYAIQLGRVLETKNYGPTNRTL